MKSKKQKESQVEDKQKKKQKEQTYEPQLLQRKLKIRIENDPLRPPVQLTRRFKVNMRVISQGGRNKLSVRFQDIDRLFICRKTKEQRLNMGTEFDDIKLIDVYTKSNPNKVSQKYGKQFIMNLLFNYQGQPTIKRIVKVNPEYQPPQIPTEEEIEEEKLLDEQKLFQSLHEALQELQKKYNKTTEQISELFVRVCGDLTMVEQALQGKQVQEWTYLEDLALTKPFESTEYQWLLNSKGQKQIEKRRKFLLTAENETENQQMNEEDQDIEMIAAQDPAHDESVPYA